MTVTSVKSMALDMEIGTLELPFGYVHYGQCFHFALGPSKFP